MFLLRGLLVQAGHARWAPAPLPRILSYAIDTTLLTAALVLLTILPSSVYANGWLIAKLALLPAYIGLGWLALRGDGLRAQLGLFRGRLARLRRHVCHRPRA